MSTDTNTTRREMATRFLTSREWEERYLDGPDIRDDDEIARFMLILNWERGWETVAVASVEDAERYLARHRPEMNLLVLVDLDEGVVYEQRFTRVGEV